MQRETTVSGEWLVVDFDAEPITYREVYAATLKDGHGGPGGFVTPFVTLEVARRITAMQQAMLAGLTNVDGAETDHLQETSEGVFTLRASYGETWTVEAGDDGLYDFGFGWTWYEVDASAEAKPAEAKTEETIERDDHDEWTCICRNTSSGSGFQPCLLTGVIVEPTTEEWIDGYLYLCLDCDRIIMDRFEEGLPLVIGLAKMSGETTETDRAAADKADARQRFAAAMRDFVAAGMRVSDAWQADGFNADEEWPLPQEIAPPLSFDEWIEEIAQHYQVWQV